MKRSDSRNSMVGNGKVDAIQIASLGFSDTLHPLMYIGSDLGALPGEDTRKRIKKQTMAISTAGAGTTLRVVLTRYMVDETGSALAASVVCNIDGTEYTTTTGGKIVHNIDGATYTTLHDLIVAINALPGFVARIGDALTTYSMATNDFVAVSETDLNEAQISLKPTLFRDVSEIYVASIRVGLPRKWDNDPLQLLGISGTLTGVTAGTVKVIRDDMNEYVAGGAHQEVYETWTAAAAQTAYLDDNVLEGATIRGSVVIQVASTDLSAANISIKYRQGLAV